MSAEFSKLYQAIVSNNQIVYTELINSNTDVLKETVEHSKDTLLHVAANWKRRDIAEIIIDLRPSLLLEVNAKGETPLHVAASAGSEDVTQLIMGRRHQIESAEIGENVLRRKTEIEKETALHKAVRNGHLWVVELLIREDPELTKLVNKDGDSPLFMAVNTLQIKVARHILTVPDCSFQGSKNMNALHAAIARRYCSFKGMENMNPFKDPLTFICNLYLLIWRNNNPFEAAIAARNRARNLQEAARGIVTSLIQIIEAGLVEHQEEYFGWTPLHLAAHMNDTQTIQLLLSAKHSAACIRDSNGMTALHVAAKQGHVRAVEKLVKICPEIVGS